LHSYFVSKFALLDRIGLQIFQIGILKKRETRLVHPVHPPESAFVNIILDNANALCQRLS